MEKKVLKWMTWCFGLLTVFMCAGLYFMPALKEGFVAAMHTLPEHMLQETLIEIESNTVLVEKKLNIELPEGITGQDIKIK